MATRRRDIAPRKDKTGPSPSHTPPTHLKATSIFPSKTSSPPQNHNPRKLNIPTSLKATLRTSAIDVSKQRVIKKPTSTDTPPHKPSQKTHVSTNPYNRDKTPLPSQKTHVTTSTSIRSRDKTPLPERKTHVPTSTSIRSRDRTPLPERKTHVVTNPPNRDKTPLPARKTQVSTNPSIRDRTPLPTRKTHVLTNSSHQSRDKTPLPAQKRHIPTNPSIRDETPLPVRKTQGPTNPSIQSRDKTPLPARKTHATTSTTLSLRSSSVPRKTIASQKTVPGKSSKTLNNDVCSLHATPLSTTLKKSDINGKGQETEKGNDSVKKEQITNTCQENVENSNVYQNYPEVETLPEDQECCTIVETEEHIVQVVSNGEKGTVDFLLDDQEKSLKIKAKRDDDTDAKIDINEPSPVVELQETHLGIETQEYEEKLHIEEKLEEISVHEIDNTNNSNKSVADDYPKEEDEEKEVEKVVVVENNEEKEEEKVFDKNDEVASESEAIKSMETKRHEVVENLKQEPENKAQKQGELKGKKDSVVSNDVIEETANKLREQRKNRVRALAGAFETVISLQN